MPGLVPPVGGWGVAMIARVGGSDRLHAQVSHAEGKSITPTSFSLTKLSLLRRIFLLFLLLAFKQGRQGQAELLVPFYLALLSSVRDGRDRDI